MPFIEKTFLNVPLAWIIVYVILVFTDKLDGTLARKFKAETDLGAALDSLGDVLILVMGGTICFVWFVRDSLETWRFWIYVVIMLICAFNKLFGYYLVKVYHNKGNLGHSFYYKAFSIWCYMCIFFWAFLRTIPPWSIYIVMLLNIIATTDEFTYIIRSTEYSPDFKGHGFEKYQKRSK